LFLKRVVAGSALLGTGVITGLGAASAFGEVRVVKVSVRLRRLPRELAGFRIALISDLHLGPVLGRPHLEAIVRSINHQKPDMVAIAGDLVDMPVELLGEELRCLTDLRTSFGTFFVTGNHEYIYGVQEWMDFMRTLGIQVLDNRRISIADGLDLAGVHDARGYWFHPGFQPDLEAALAGRDPERELILLAHQPRQIEEAAAHGVGLQLSGHTHGGQIFPFGLFTWMSQPYLYGLHRHGEHTQIYVTRGAGFWGPPMRVLAPPEIALIVLDS
jgi:predicted MPP superfamily phosphohydrolase